MKKLLILMGLCPALALAQGQGTNINKIIARVDNYYILKSDLQEAKANYEQNGQKVPDEGRVLESLIINKLLLAKSEIDSVSVEDKVIDGQLEQRMQYMAQRFGSEKNIVAAYGKSIEALKAELRQPIKEQALIEKMQDKITEAIKVTPSDVRKFFSGIPKDSLPYIPAEAEIGHIVRMAKVTKSQKEDLRKRLFEYKARIERGEEFAKLATEYSEDLGSGKQGGDLGFAKRGQMVSAFEGAVLKLKPNQISDPVESEFGFHLIQMLETRGAEYHARHILLRPEYNRMDVTEPTRVLDSLRSLIQKDTLKFEKAAKDWSEDKPTADAGGMLIDPASRTSKLPLDQSMEPTLYFTLDSMKVGMITAPVSYRTEDGRTGMRILWYKNKIEPHIADLKDDYEKIYNIVLQNKKARAVDEWFRKAVADVFIKVEPEYSGYKIFGVNGQ